MSRRIKDLTGQTFGRLTVIEFAGKDKHGAAKWRCYCACGNSPNQIVLGRALTVGCTKSCGCLVKELHTKHGLRWHPLYRVWLGMKDRCYNVKKDRYPRYGGRGIIVCDRWKESLENFIEDMYPTYTEGMQIDRINNDGNYEPTNCRWVTPKQNSMNKGSQTGSTSKYKGGTPTETKWKMGCSDKKRW